MPHISARCQNPPSVMFRQSVKDYKMLPFLIGLNELIHEFKQIVTDFQTNSFIRNKSACELLLLP